MQSLRRKLLDKDFVVADCPKLDNEIELRGVCVTQVKFRLKDWLAH